MSLMAMELKINSNDLQKGWDLACCHHFTNMVRGKSFSGLLDKLDTLHSQIRPFSLKYQGFDRKQSKHKGITLFLNPLNPNIFIWSTLSIHTNILKFQTFLSSFGNLNAYNELFLSIMTLKLKIDSNELYKGQTWHVVIISPTWSMVKVSVEY